MHSVKGDVGSGKHGNKLAVLYTLPQGMLNLFGGEGLIGKELFHKLIARFGDRFIKNTPEIGNKPLHILGNGNLNGNAVFVLFALHIQKIHKALGFSVLHIHNNLVTLR